MDPLILKQKFTDHSKMYYKIAERQVNVILSIHRLIAANIILYKFFQSASQ
jgi:hypothetical protein